MEFEGSDYLWEY